MTILKIFADGFFSFLKVINCSYNWSLGLFTHHSSPAEVSFQHSWCIWLGFVRSCQMMRPRGIGSCLQSCSCPTASPRHISAWWWPLTVRAWLSLQLEFLLEISCGDIIVNHRVRGGAAGVLTFFPRWNINIVVPLIVTLHANLFQQNYTVPDFIAKCEPNACDDCLRNVFLEGSVLVWLNSQVLSCAKHLDWFSQVIHEVVSHSWVMCLYYDYFRVPASRRQLFRLMYRVQRPDNRVIAATTESETVL